MAKTTATLLHRRRYSETSLIVSWCSAEAGLLRTLAKGALRPRSAFAGRLDLFVTAEIDYLPSRRSDLHTLRECEVTRHRHQLHQSWRRVMAASYFVQLLELVAERETPVPELADLLTRALDYLNSQEPDWRAVLHFEHELARVLGIHAPRRGAAIQAIHAAYHQVPPLRQRLSQLLCQENAATAPTPLPEDT